MLDCLLVFGGLQAISTVCHPKDVLACTNVLSWKLELRRILILLEAMSR
jgi:hypothetical protein